MLLRGNSEPKEANSHRIFGKEENVAYLDRRGIYIIPIKGVVLVIKVVVKRKKIIYRGE